MGAMPMEGSDMHMHQCSLARTLLLISTMKGLGEDSGQNSNLKNDLTDM